MVISYILIFVHLGLLILSGCRSQAKHNLVLPPDKIDDGWNVASPLQFDANIILLDSMIQKIETGEYVNIHSVLIVKDGLLIVEEYFDDYDRNTLHEIRSATKSVGSILVGIAIDKGLIASDKITIYEYFKDQYTPSYGWNSHARQVNLGHLLSMMSGYNCDDIATDFACEDAMYDTDDWVQYALDLPLSSEPGIHWAYNSSSLILAGEIVSRGSGMKLEHFADRYLFNPLGISRFQWNFSPKGRAWIGGGAKMIPREMAKIGLLMQKNGKWDNNRILSVEWIEKSTQKQGNMLGGVDYCYLWQRGWTPYGEDLITAFWASGNGGQYIIILPDVDMVIVFTGGNYNSSLAGQPFRMLTRYIVPAFLQSKPREQISLQQEYLNSLTGIYTLDFDTSVTSTIDVYEKKLRIQTPDNQYISLIPVSRIQFKGKSSLYGPLIVRFIEDTQGKVINFIAYGSFERYTFEKR